jgi:hypothetical protein
LQQYCVNGHRIEELIAIRLDRCSCSATDSWCSAARGQIIAFVCWRCISAIAAAEHRADR